MNAFLVTKAIDGYYKMLQDSISIKQKLSSSFFLATSRCVSSAGLWVRALDSAPKAGESGHHATLPFPVIGLLSSQGVLFLLGPEQCWSGERGEASKGSCSSFLLGVVVLRCSFALCCCGFLSGLLSPPRTIFIHE